MRSQPRQPLLYLYLVQCSTFISIRIWFNVLLLYLYVSGSMFYFYIYMYLEPYPNPLNRRNRVWLFLNKNKTTESSSSSAHEDNRPVCLPCHCNKYILFTILYPSYRVDRPAASHWQTLSHNVVSSTPRHERGSNSLV
jgi:hypothetical protein